MNLLQSNMFVLSVWTVVVCSVYILQQGNCNDQIGVARFNRLVREVDLHIEDKQFESALLKLSDAFYELRYIVNNPQRTSMLKARSAILIEKLKSDNYTRQLIESTFDKHQSWLIENWFGVNMANDDMQDPNALFDWRSNYIFREFLSKLLAKATLDESLDPGFLLKAISEGKGICYLFKHPKDPEIPADELSQNEAHKLGFFIHLTTTETQTFDRNQPALVLSQLSIACDSFANSPLNNNEYKALLSNLLDPIDNKEPKLNVRDFNDAFYNSIRSVRSICGRIVRLDKEELKHRFPLASTQNIFYDACISDLTSLVRAFTSSDRLMYTCCVYQRWADRISEFVANYKQRLRMEKTKEEMAPPSPSISKQEHTDDDIFSPISELTQLLNPRLNDSFNKYMKNMTLDLPSEGAILAYNCGTGICEQFVNSHSKSILENLKNISKVVDISNLKELTDFVYVMIVILNLKEKEENAELECRLM